MRGSVLNIGHSGAIVRLRGILRVPCIAFSGPSLIFDLHRGTAECFLLAGPHLICKVLMSFPKSLLYPKTLRSASTTADLPLPLAPMMQVDRERRQRCSASPTWKHRRRDSHDARKVAAGSRVAYAGIWKAERLAKAVRS